MVGSPLSYNGAGEGGYAPPSNPLSLPFLLEVEVGVSLLTPSRVGLDLRVGNDCRLVGRCAWPLDLPPRRQSSAKNSG